MRCCPDGHNGHVCTAGANAACAAALTVLPSSCGPGTQKHITSQAAAKAAASKAAAAAREEASHQAGRIRALEAELAKRRTAEDALTRQLQVRHRQSRSSDFLMVVTFYRRKRGVRMGWMRDHPCREHFQCNKQSYLDATIL